MAAFFHDRLETIASDLAHEGDDAPSRFPASDPPLRIALFSGNYDCVRDGANQALNRLVGHLLMHPGAQVRIYSPTNRRPAFQSVGDVRSVPSVGIPGRSEYRFAVGLTQTVRDDLAVFRPNIIHVSAPDRLGRQAQLYGQAQNIPIIASLHTRFETYLDYYRLSFLRPAVERYLDRFYAASDVILAPNAGIAAEMTARHGAAHVAIWGRGVDRRLFHPRLRCTALRRSKGYADGEVVPLFFGRLVREKGLGIFIDAINALRDRSLRIRPMIVGDGPARAWFAERLANATFMGHLEGQALGRAVASADILINPSVTEAFGNVNLEAMASGLAIVSADMPSAAALIDHGRTGLLVGQPTAATLADAAETLMSDDARRRDMGAAAARAANDFSWDAYLSSVVDVYRKLLREKAAALP